MRNGTKLVILLVVIIAAAAGSWYFFGRSGSSINPGGPPTGNVNLSKYGVIEGETGFPTAAPADLQVCAASSSGATTCTNAYSDQGSTHGFSYHLAVLPGTYQVYAYSKSNPSVGKAYYNTVAKCVPTVDEDNASLCKKNIANLNVTVAAGQTVGGIDTWYYAAVYGK